METLTRLVTESLARHGFDRPLDYRHRKGSHWFRCQSHRSLLAVAGQPGVFARARQVMDLESSKAQVEPAGSLATSAVEGAVAPRLSAAKGSGSRARRMTAVGQFFEHREVAFVLDRMWSRANPMRTDHDRRTTPAPRLNSAIATTIHCSSSFPSRFVADDSRRVNRF
jgi:hypothetical protein